MSPKPTIKRTLPRKEKKSDGPVPEMPVDIEDTTEAVVEEEELLMDKIRPHLGTICLVGIAAVLTVIAYQFWNSANFQSEAVKWGQLNQARTINLVTGGDVSELNKVADEFPEERVGLIGAMYTADSQLRNGIYQLGRDREGGLNLVEKARDNFKSVVDADDRLKTPWLSQRAQFSYAYACETLGEFDKAKESYKFFVENAADSPLFEKAKRGLARVSNEQFVALYDTFKTYEASAGMAPGPLGSETDRPGTGIDAFKDIDIEPGEKPPVEGEGTDGSADDKAPEGTGEKADPAETETPTQPGDDASSETQSDEEPAKKQPDPAKEDAGAPTAESPAPAEKVEPKSDKPTSEKKSDETSDEKKSS